MKFSVVVPVYDRASTVRPTLLSVARQTHRDLECIVVDDGSSDGEELARVVASLEDDRFRLVRQENAGGGVARNTGILAATGDYVALLDSDDTFFVGKLARVALALAGEEDGVSVVYHPALVERGGGRTAIRPSRPIAPDEPFLDFTFRHREFVQTSTIVVRADVAKRVLFDPTLRKAQDIDFLMRVEREPGRFLWIDETLSVWNDAPAEGRVGAPRRPESVVAWFDRNRDAFTPATAAAFEATYLSYEIAYRRPDRALGMILRGIASRSVSPKAAVQASVRAFLPQPIYRRLVDAVATRRGPSTVDPSPMETVVAGRVEGRSTSCVAPVDASLSPVVLPSGRRAGPALAATSR